MYLHGRDRKAFGEVESVLFAQLLDSVFETFTAVLLRGLASTVAGERQQTDEYGHRAPRYVPLVASRIGTAFRQPCIKQPFAVCILADSVRFDFSD
ncbi:MAG: hypothetical protein IJU11_07790 [Prevotella sp.]|nr:hypothetical protein [Prevotella sp.]